MDDGEQRSRGRLRAAMPALLGVVVASPIAAFTLLRWIPWQLPWPQAPLLALTPQVTLATTALAVCALLLRRWVTGAVLLLCAALLAIVVLPRAFPTGVRAGEAELERAKAEPGRVVRVVSANLRVARADPDALAAIVRREKPDLLLLQEMHHDRRKAYAEAGVFDRLPHYRRDPPGFWRDTAVASRWPLERLHEAMLPNFYNPVSVRIPRRARPLPVVSAHPLPPLKPHAQRPWRSALAAVSGGRHGPLAGGIVAGDLNATLDHPELRALLDRGWRDAARVSGAGLDPTWGREPLRTLAIDHVLVAPGIRVAGFRTHRLPGSDHRAIAATLILPADDSVGAAARRSRR